MEDLDLSLIGELLETIEQHPPAIEARRLLIQSYIEAGLFNVAGEAARELLVLDPDDPDAQEWFLAFHHDDPQRLPDSQRFTGNQSSVTRPLPGGLESAKRQLSQGYQELRTRAKRLQGDLHILRDLLGKKGASFRYDKHVHDVVTDIANGQISKVVRARRPASARAVSRAMESEPDKALEIAITDLAGMARWLGTPTNQDSAMDNDGIREALVKRVRTLIAALPDELQSHASCALMHVEHEVLNRSYVYNETMYGDLIADVPRERFWVSEDGYAWDMDELAQALASNGEVMRNPLSRQMFTPNDVRAIVQHPLGNRLAALQVEQSMLSQGLRPKTIEQLEILARVLLEDMSLDSIPSRQAVDGFLAYVATLPQAEQKAIDVLRVPAKDSHTGQPFDTSIGEAVRDAQGNRVCFHKTGDFIRQAAQYLRRSA